ncbi:nicotinamide mononucleotide transporter [Moraxella caviae]|uniref:Nicotinamide riboside transporter PnuC n=1 Tax=Moraxella caviae TaxID=34060 RepID=A0A1S9ZV54_9GAMM|nr:nicotinamide riboside transporter PnuC [Moraxella caviae]OOR87395.1 nicotinamide mononucleotide transporter [Moraxella caviae]STZ10379.1 Nicotinamide riboside transporter pnuC [Moraxella caviae]VEW10543.1 Nicotinamide riboside transporter pnuC [Moraxella caviae]
MKIRLLDNITGQGEQDWSLHWILLWFACGVVALYLGFWFTTTQTALDWFYLAVSVVGLLCVVGLSFRKNVLGNGFGMLATSGEVVVQATAGAVGLMLAPLFNFFTHAYGAWHWHKHTGDDGLMIPKSANHAIWLITIVFVVVGLLLFPVINDWLFAKGFGVIAKDGETLFGVSFFWINVAAFVLSIAAQTTMILRYSFNWWIWIAVNFVWLLVNLMTHNYIFAIQTVIYQINSVVGLYGWYRSEQLAKA